MTMLFDPDRFIDPSHREAEAHQRIQTLATPSDLIDASWITRAAAEGLVAREFFSWVLEDERMNAGRLLDLLEEKFDVVTTANYRRAGKLEAIVRVGDALVDVSLAGRQRIWVGVAAGTQQEARGVMEHLLNVLPERPESADEQAPRIPISVWTNESREPMTRPTDVQPWERLADNYASVTRERLEHLMSPDFEAGKGGKLILLHGAPGTGKSTAIMSLGWQWRKFGQLNYIADVANFLNEPEYLLRVTFGGGPEDDWRVVVLEDSGGLFAPDAKQSTGEDRLGRLLNLTDGVLGNASKTLVVLTTNEPVSSFHAAVSRPGRCAAIVEFLPFSQEEARSWLEKRGRGDLTSAVDGERTLAECYALVGGNQVEIKPKRQVGFAAGGA